MDLYLNGKKVGPLNIEAKTKVKHLKKSLNDWAKQNNLGEINIQIVFADSTQLDPIIFKTDKYDEGNFKQYQNILKGGKIFVTNQNVVSKTRTQTQNKKGEKIETRTRTRTETTPTLPRDVLYTIAQNADDRTVLNILATNKTMNNPQFFKQIFEKRYPNLLRFKKPDEDLRHFYIEMVHYIAKLKEEFGIDYLPNSKIFNPREEYYQIKFAIAADLPDLLRLCQSNKDINRKLCQQDAIWNRKLKRDFGEYLDFQAGYPDFKPIFEKSKKEYYTFLYRLNKIKTVWKLKDNLYELYYLPELNLDNRSIKIIPKEIGQLHNLQTLYLADNQIESIPKEIGQLHNLKVLTLSGNPIEDKEEIKRWIKEQIPGVLLRI
jgi:hypothetical protein